MSRRRRPGVGLCTAILAALWGTACASGAIAVQVKAEPVAYPPAWVIDPANPGENLPSVGRSLFDRAFAAVRDGQTVIDLPFPFEALLARLDAQLARDPASTLPPAKRVLIPLGRSLQRHAAAPDYFAFPRIVVAVDSPPASPSAPLLKDRLYIGYQEKSAVLEIISYNEAAGRFEFQLVKNYRAGSTPQVVYANRTLCFACHQNGAPIFSRALWDETNANPQVAARLAARATHFHGIPPNRGVDIPYAIDIAVGRANGFALIQRLWDKGCGGDDPTAGRCRATLFTATLRHALADGRKGKADSVFTREVAAPMVAEAARRWPNGLAVGNAGIPNRNPLPGLMDTGAEQVARRVADAEVPARFDPLDPRLPQAVWQGEDAAIEALVGGLAEFVAATDRRRLDDVLAERPAEAVRHRMPCRFEPGASRWSVHCRPPAGERGPQLAATLEVTRGKFSRGRLERLVLPDGGAFSTVALGTAESAPGERVALVPSGKPHPRSADGNRLARVAFSVSPSNPAEGDVAVEFRQEFAAVEKAVAELLDGEDGAQLFGARPFPREALFSALFSRLGTARAEPCCRAAETLPPPRLEVPAAAPGSRATRPMGPAVQGFYPYCAACHQSTEAFPPNFLQGNAEQVAAAMRQCAPRIYVRLAMADLAPHRREKTPMPPESLLPAFATDIAGWRASPARAALLAQVGDWLRAETGQAPDLNRFLAGGYEALRPCLPAP